MNTTAISFPDSVSISSEQRRDISNRIMLIEKALANAANMDDQSEKWAKKVSEIEAELAAMNNKLATTENFDSKLNLTMKISTKQNVLGIARGELAKQMEIAERSLGTVKDSIRGIEEIYDQVMQTVIDKHLNEICDSLAHLFKGLDRARVIAWQFDSVLELIYRKKRWNSVQHDNFESLEAAKLKIDEILTELKAFVRGENPFKFPRQA